MNQSIYTVYVNQILRYPLLSAEQEKDLSKKIESGDTKAKEQLINANLRLVVSIAIKYSANSHFIMDIIQEGNLGLIAAAAKYHYSFKTRFSTYAYAWISQYILRYIQDRTSEIYIPALKREQLHMLKLAAAELMEKLHRKPTNQELAVYLGSDEDSVRKIKQYDYSTVSLYTNVDDEAALSLADMLPDDSANPELETLKQFERKDYMNIFESLPPKERSVMLSRYRSFVSGTKLTLREMGSKLGFSAEVVRQLEIRAHVKLRPIIENYTTQFA